MKNYLVRKMYLKQELSQQLAEKNAEAYVRKYFEDNNLNAVRAEIIRLGRLCQGAKKTTGQHPGGMVIVPQEFYL